MGTQIQSTNEPGATTFGLPRVGGACAIAYVLLVIVVLILLGALDLLQTDLSADEVLTRLDEDRGLALTTGWLFVLAPFPLAVAGLAMFNLIRRAGSWTLIAPVAFVGGSLLALIRNVLLVAMADELAPAYAAANPDERSELAAVGDTMLSYGYVIGDVLGGVLAGGAGVGLFSLAILVTGLAPRWVGWLGLAAAIGGGLLTPLAPTTALVEALNAVGGLAFFLWMIVIGAVLWRSGEPTAHEDRRIG